jgi:hypothetical protein
MNSEFHRFRQKQTDEVQNQQLSHAAQTQTAQEFATVDDLLRYDSEHNPIPPEVERRVNDSITAEPRQPRSWWKKIFGGK